MDMRHFVKMLFLVAVVFGLYQCSTGKTVYVNTLSLTSVPEEGGFSFIKITDDADQLATPDVRVGKSAPAGYSSAVGSIIGKVSPDAYSVTNVIRWWLNPQLAVSPDGKKVAYIARKNNMCNIMVKSAAQGGGSTQRTYRNFVTDFTWTNKDKICFTEYRNGKSMIFLTNAEQGAVVQQVSPEGVYDYAGVISGDGSNLFFHRMDAENSYSIWSYDRAKNMFSNYSRGLTPCPAGRDRSSYYCTRFTDRMETEIWKVNYDTGVEEVLLSQPGRSFATPMVSPDGEWIICVGSSLTPDNVLNTDIFAIKTDGSHLTQLTYHPGNDISPAWSPDGNYIYFISQRGSADGAYNVWRMNFDLQ